MRFPNDNIFISILANKIIPKEESVVLNNADSDIKELYYKTDKTNVLLYNLAQSILSNNENRELSIISGSGYELTCSQDAYLNLLKKEIKSSLYFKYSSNNIASALLAIASTMKCYTSSVYNGQTTGNDLLGLAAIKLVKNFGSVLLVISDYTKERDTLNASVALITNNENAHIKCELSKTIFLYKSFISIDESLVYEIWNYISSMVDIDSIWIIGLDAKNQWHETLISMGASQKLQINIISIDKCAITTGFDIINNIHDKICKILLIELESQRLSIIGIKYN